MSLISVEEFQRLIDQTAEACVSIYLPTERSGKETQQNAIRFKNLVRRAEQCVVERKLMRPRQTQELFRPAHELMEDAPFWQHQWDGLAVFLSSRLYRRFRVPIRFTELAEVKHRFHVKPLLKLLSGDGEFFLLSLNRKLGRFFKSTRYHIEELDLGDTPTSLLDVIGPETDTHQLQWRTAAPGGRGERSALFHGHGGGAEDLTPELRRFLAAVDTGVQRLLRDRPAPLLLAGSEDLLALYRETTDQPHRVAGELRLNTSDMREEELREKAWSVVEPLFAREQREAAGRYRELIGTGRASSDVREIVPASQDGRVETLFVARGRYRWGRYDAEVRDVFLQNEPGNGAQDLLDCAAVHTLRHKGRVFVVEADLVPDEGGPIAAVFRY
jgi:hypothetical protein